MAGLQELANHIDPMEAFRLPWNGVPIDVPLGVNERGMGALDAKQIPTWVLPVGGLIAGILLLKAFEGAREELAIRKTAKQRARDHYKTSLAELRESRKKMRAKLRTGELDEDEPRQVPSPHRFGRGFQI